MKLDTSHSPQILKRFFLLVLLLFLLLMGGAGGYKFYLERQTIQQYKIHSPEGIEEMTSVLLGGIKQWVLIRGENRTHPVLLFLHGGPGAPLFPHARKIGMNTRLEEMFVVVYWEQRGTGKSFHPAIPDSLMSIPQLVADTRDLTDWLREQFQVPKIYLLARSWGTVIGLLTIHQYPEKFQAYIAIGQVVHPLKGDSLAYQYSLQLAHRFNHSRALQELQETGWPPYSHLRLLTQRKWLTYFYEKIMAEQGITQPGGYKTHLKNLLATPEYSWWDILKMGRDPYFALKHLWNDSYYQLNFFQKVAEVDIPVYFISGKYDLISPPILIEKYYHFLKADKGKKFFLIDQAGHHPEYETPQKFFEIMLKEVLPETGDYLLLKNDQESAPGKFFNSAEIAS